MVAKAQRNVTLMRLVEAGKVGVTDGDGPTARNFYVDCVMVAQQDTNEPSYPSEYVMATLMLAIGATVGFDGVRMWDSALPANPYHQRLRDSNKHREGM